MEDPNNKGVLLKVLDLQTLTLIRRTPMVKVMGMEMAEGTAAGVEMAVIMAVIMAVVATIGKDVRKPPIPL